MNGYIFDLNQKERIKDIIISLNDEVYTKLLAGVRKFSINEKDINQLGVYFEN